MKISLKGMSNRELGKLFDRAAKANNRRLAKTITYRLAYRHHESFDAQTSIFR